MKQIKNQKTYIKLIIFALVLTLSMVLFIGCGSTSDETKESGNTGVTQEEPKTDEDITSDATGGTQEEPKTDEDSTGQRENGTDTEGTGSNETPSSNDQNGTSDQDSDNETNTPTNPTTPASTCTIQINCKLLVGKDLSGTGLETLVPDDGIILGTTKVTLNPGDTVYDVTLRVTKAKRIHMASQGSVSLGTIYIEAISNIYEKDYNRYSGWVYLVNGTKPGIGSGVKELKAGDALVWAYSLDNGTDL